MSTGMVTQTSYSRIFKSEIQRQRIAPSPQIAVGIDCIGKNSRRPKLIDARIYIHERFIAANFFSPRKGYGRIK